MGRTKAKQIPRGHWQIGCSSSARAVEIAVILRSQDLKVHRKGRVLHGPKAQAPEAFLASYKVIK